MTILRSTSLAAALAAATLALPGWTADVKSNGDTSAGGVRVVFANMATGQKVYAKIEPGKTWIR